jgi:hypothetical protein
MIITRGFPGILQAMFFTRLHNEVVELLLTVGAYWCQLLVPQVLENSFPYAGINISELKHNSAPNGRCVVEVIVVSFKEYH